MLNNRGLIAIEGIPLYVQIRESIRKDIHEGRLTIGQKLPPEEELAQQFGVSRMTMRRALNDLVEEGLLYRKQGIGTFVSRPQIDRDHTRLTNFFESAKEKGINASIRVLIADIVPSHLKVANALGLEEGELVIRIKTLRLADDVPVSVVDHYVPYKFFPRLLDCDLEAGHLWDFLEEFGFRVKAAVQTVYAREADLELSELLKINPGEPILYKERTVYAEDGTAIEFTYCFNRGDQYSITMRLTR
jgi:GntR family transcriptional regulator